MAHVWTSELTAIRDELGATEINIRIAQLSDYNSKVVIASFYGDGGEYGRDSGNLTPAQMLKWAEFAKSLGEDITLTAGAIRRAKPRDELVFIVCENEYNHRN
jgi:hypothetical protein